jgi:hypothetical protein
LHISEKSSTFASAKDTSMTDTEYIQAFRARNNKAISLFYREYRESFMAFLANKFHSLNQQLLAEVFQESVSRVWENIERGKLSLLLGRIYYVGLTILRRIADYFVQNRRFFLQESQIFCTFAANFEKYTI